MEEDGSGSGWMAIWYLYEKFDPGRQGQSNLKNSKFHFFKFYPNPKSVLQRLGFLAEPLLGTAFQQGTDLGPDLFMMSIQPSNLISIQKIPLDELLLDWCHGYVFKGQVANSTKVMFKLDFLDKKDVLNSDTKLAILIVTRLVCDGHARLEGSLIAAWTE